jgi:hypothetical protein
VHLWKSLGPSVSVELSPEERLPRQANAPDGRAGGAVVASTETGRGAEQLQRQDSHAFTALRGRLATEGFLLHIVNLGDSMTENDLLVYFR